MKLKLISTIHKFQEGGKTERKETQDRGEILGRKKLYKDNSQLSEEKLKEAADKDVYSLKDLINKKLQSGISGKEKRMLKRSLKHLDKNEDLFRLDKDGKIVATNEDGSYAKTHTGLGEGLRKIFGGKQDKDIATGRELKDLNFAKSLLGANSIKEYTTDSTSQTNTNGNQTGTQYVPTEADEKDVEDALPKEKPKPSNNTGTGGKTNSGGSGVNQGKQRTSEFDSLTPDEKIMYKFFWNTKGGSNPKAFGKTQDDIHKYIMGRISTKDANYQSNLAGIKKEMDLSQPTVTGNITNQPQLTKLYSNSSPVTGIDVTHFPTKDTDIYGRSRKPEQTTVRVGSNNPQNSNFTLPKFTKEDLANENNAAIEKIQSDVKMNPMSLFMGSPVLASRLPQATTTIGAKLVTQGKKIGETIKNTGSKIKEGLSNLRGKTKTSNPHPVSNINTTRTPIQTNAASIDDVRYMSGKSYEELAKLTGSRKYNDIIAAFNSGKISKLKVGGKLFQQGGELEQKYMNSVKERMAVIDNELNGIMQKLDESRNTKQGVQGTRSYSNVANNTDLAQKDLRRRAQQLIFEKKKLGNMPLSQKHGLPNSLLSQNQIEMKNGGTNNQQNNMAQTLKFGGELKKKF